MIECSCFPILISVSLSSNGTWDPKVASASANLFSLRQVYSMLKVWNSCSSLCAQVLQATKLCSLSAKSPFTWETTRLESPNTFMCFTPILSATVNPVKYASYLTALLEQENPSLKGKGMVSPSSQLSTTPTPFEVVVADYSNLIVHFFPWTFAIATSHGISSLSELSSSHGNCANRSAMA